MGYIAMDSSDDQSIIRKAGKLTFLLTGGQGKRKTAQRPSGRPQEPLRPGPTDGPDEGPPPVRGNGEPGCDHNQGEQAPSPRHRLRDRLPYWRATMHQLGSVCARTLSVITGGFRMDWDPALSEASPVFLRNHPSAFA